MEEVPSAVVITYLEMLQKPQAFIPAVPPGMVIRRIQRPSPVFYRKLYRSVGEKWSWADRLHMDDHTLKGIIQDPRVEVRLLLEGQLPLGYAELDLRLFPDIELTYLGIVPDAIGRGLGKCLLARAIHSAWQHEPRRLWLHTCSLDHPGALGFYVNNGFTVYKQELNSPPSKSGRKSSPPSTPFFSAGG